MTAGTLGVGRAAAVAALAGVACMAAELAAVRVQAPHFGDSAYVWTNVIGVILAAWAAGAWVGGRLAPRPGAAALLAGMLVAAGGLLGLAPYLAGPLGDWLLPPTLPLDAAMPAIVRGSLLATLLLFAPPMLLLGSAGPMLVARLSTQGVAVGRAAGAVSAAGTAGSLLGTFAATHWLIPTFGCRLALGAAGGVLLLAASLLLATWRGRAGPGALLVLVLVGGIAPRGPLRAPLAGQELLAERESRYQFLQVVREPLPDGGRRTLLVINEGLDSFHSVAVDGSCFTGGAYYDWHALAPLLVAPGGRPAHLRALSIGDAAGSLRAVYAGVHPGVPVDAVDIDPACLELGELHFRGEKAVGERTALDGRVYLQQAQRRWHVIHVDAYAHQVYVPAHLASREFFELAHRQLEVDGVLACNVGALHAGDPVLRAIGTTIAAVFGHALALPVPRSRNFLVVARKGERPDVARLPTELAGGERLSADDATHWRTILRTAAAPDRWQDVGTGGEVLTDDRPVLDELLHQSYVRGARAVGLVACEGSIEPTGAESAAYAARARLDWQAVLAAVASSRLATPYLREVAGDARWSMRELQAATAEYEAALALVAPGDAAARQRLQGYLQQLLLDRGPGLAAEQTATRNGWLLFGLLGAMAAGVAAWSWRSRSGALPG